MKLDKGLSGCQIYLEDNLIKKISKDSNYNKRLEKQMLKQLDFSKFKLTGIKVPRILESGYQDAVFYFLMEYIPGMSPLDLFSSCNTKDVENFIYSITNYLNLIFSSTQKYTRKEFYNMITDKLNSLMLDSNHKEFIFYLISQCELLEDHLFIKSSCHGDLTLSNMIYFDNNIYLIDFLDSFINSPLIDLVKLKQDLYYDWSLNLMECMNPHDKKRITQITKFIWEKIETQFSKYTKSKLFCILESINFLRIEPYIKDNVKSNYLDKIIKSLYYYEKFNNTNVWQIKSFSGTSSEMDADTS
jgi:hypothetical protein